MKLFDKLMFAIVCILGLGFMLGVTADASESNRAANIKSRGIVNFKNGSVVLDSADFTYLAAEIDDLEYTYKSKTLAALHHIGTYYKTDGSITHNSAESAVDLSSASILTFQQLTDGIRTSQSVDAGAAFLKNGMQMYQLPNGTVTEDGSAEGAQAITITEAGASNLTAGTAAWVNGSLIIGEGLDNASYYAQGFIDGQQNVTEHLDIEYTYHVHEGAAGTAANGCYTKPVYHSHGNGCYCNYGVTLNRYSDHNGAVYGYCANGHFHTRSGSDYSLGSYLGICGFTVCGQTSVIEGYSIGCGKTEQTIESATIKY